MRNKRLLILALTFLLLFSIPVFALDYLYSAKVERVIDGDTIVVDLSLGLGVVLDDQYIRFYGIDAWEIQGEERLKEGKIEIEIRPEWGQNGKGKYGRWLGVVYIDGVNVNIELVEEGYAEQYQEED